MNPNFPPQDFLPMDSTIPGIEVFRPAAEQEEHREVVDFSCPQCGATTAYSIAEGGLTCVHCGYYEAPSREVVGKGAQAFEFTVETVERAAQGWGETRKELACQNCGAVTTFPQESLTHTCPFCASNKVVQREAPQDVLRPRFLVPFQIQPDACQKIAREWLGSSWMTPVKLRTLARLADFTPIYLPFWTFDATTHAGWRAQVGHTVTDRYYDHGSRSWKTRTRIEWRWESGKVKKTFDDLQVPGTSRLSALLMGRIKAFNLTALVPYDPSFLAGMQAQAYDVLLEKAWEQGRAKMRDKTREACRQQASTGMIRSFSMTLDFSDENWRYLLLPVYVAAYTFAGQTFQVLVNGQTGIIAGQRPVDWTRVSLAIAAALGPGFLLSVIGLLTLIFGGIGVVIGGVGLFLLIIGAIITFFILRTAMQMDDA
jgi:Zn finger protein HypA/HybF involved in hydrogenase expression